MFTYYEDFQPSSSSGLSNMDTINKNSIKHVDLWQVQVYTSKIFKITFYYNICMHCWESQIVLAKKDVDEGILTPSKLIHSTNHVTNLAQSPPQFLQVITVDNAFHKLNQYDKTSMLPVTSMHMYGVSYHKLKFENGFNFYPAPAGIYSTIVKSLKAWDFIIYGNAVLKMFNNSSVIANTNGHNLTDISCLQTNSSLAYAPFTILFLEQRFIPMYYSVAPMQICFSQPDLLLNWYFKDKHYLCKDDLNVYSKLVSLNVIIHVLMTSYVYCFI